MAHSVKIGIVGEQNAGKTMLLTSLLWNLECFRKENNHFRIGKNKNAVITDFDISDSKNKNTFNFRQYKNYLCDDRTFPEKTTDYSSITITYKRNDHLRPREITFVDVPGERFADIFMWNTRDYQKWSDKLFRTLEDQPQFNSIITNYKKNAAEHGISKDELILLYKNVLAKLQDNYAAMSPSTFLLDQRGGLHDYVHESDQITKQPIWEEGDFVPLPSDCKKTNPKAYKEFERNFKLYVNKVLKPLYNEIDECNAFIFCADIFEILMSSHVRYSMLRENNSVFLKTVRPKKFMSFLQNIKLIRKPKMAFVATKSDLLHGNDINSLMNLLKDLYRAPGENVDNRYFTCAAIRAAYYDSNHDAVVGYIKPELLKEWGIQHGDETPYEVISGKFGFPQKWPSSKKWAEFKDNFNCMGSFIKPPILRIDTPPEQTNLDELFDFITE